MGSRIVIHDFMKGWAVSSARADLRSARELLAEHPLEEWLRPENIEAYKYLTEHVIKEAEGALRYYGCDETTPLEYRPHRRRRLRVRR